MNLVLGLDGKAPLMSKAQRAAKAVAENPQMSNRALADEAGVSYETVRRARTDTDVSVDEPRTGLDGRTRRQPTRRNDEYDPDLAIEQTKQSFLLGACWGR